MRVVMVIVGVGMMVGGGGVWVEAQAQQAAPQLMGTVATQDALVSGGLQVQGERAELMSNASVTAYDRTAAIALERGGAVLVCSTTQFHLLHSGTGSGLLFGLDRGALELHTPTEAQDVILTPDIRFTVATAGTYDLRLRVTHDGDTCVENAGAGAPELVLNDAFSQTSYRLLPGQHVLFEHGSLREVVDHERSECGCPGSSAGVVGPNATPAEKAAAANPFPAAVSEGLAQPAVVDNNSPAGEKHTQVTTVFTYGPGQGPPPSTVDSTPQPAAQPVVMATAPPQTPPGAHEIFHSIGHFFHKLFHPGS